MEKLYVAELSDEPVVRVWWITKETPKRYMLRIGAPWTHIPQTWVDDGEWHRGYGIAYAIYSSREAATAALLKRARERRVALTMDLALLDRAMTNLEAAMLV